MTKEGLSNRNLSIRNGDGGVVQVLADVRPITDFFLNRDVRNVKVRESATFLFTVHI